MEKRGLGRGLEDISDLFLSKREEKQPDKILSRFSSVKMRDETCESCINIIMSQTGEKRCKIFSQDYEKYGVPHIDSIIPIYANFCGYFNAVTLGPPDKNVEEQHKGADIPETDCEVEETIRIARKIAYPNSAGGQKNIRKTTFEYLEDGYKIQSIELRKSYTVSEHRKQEKMDVEVKIFVKQI